MYFTVAQANKMLPEVIKKFEVVVANNGIVTRAQAELETSVNGSMEQYMTAKRRLTDAVIKYYTSIQVLEETGVTIKSIEQGMVDFPARMFEEDVWLCWMYGEDAVRFWHEKNGGFASRKPLAVDTQSLV